MDTSDQYFMLKSLKIKCEMKHEGSFPTRSLIFALVADVSSVPASCDGFAVSLWPLHRAGGEAVEERGLVPGAEPAGAVHQFQAHAVQLPKT